jgi:endogenous inhibitor of DNA gyrase (YacG/DUF329 family)
MAMIMIKCPKTGKDVATGIKMEKTDFDSSEMSGNSVKCPHCGDMHVWDKSQAWVPLLH